MPVVYCNHVKVGKTLQGQERLEGIQRGTGDKGNFDLDFADQWDSELKRMNLGKRGSTCFPE